MPSGVSPARECAYAVVRRVFEQDAYADRALHAEAEAGLDGRDRAFAMALAYGTVQRKATLDHVAAAFTDRPLTRLDAPVLAALRLGLMQLAAAGRGRRPRRRPRVRRAGQAPRPRRQRPGQRGAAPGRCARAGSCSTGSTTRRPADAAVLHSVPVWLAELWWDELGPERARALLAAVNEPAESRDARQHARRVGGRRRRRSWAWPAAPRPASPRGSSSRRRSTPTARRQWGRGRAHAPVARLDGGGARAGARARRAGARPVRRPGGQDHPPGGARWRRGGAGRGRAPPRPRRRAAADAGAHAGALRHRGDRPTRRGARGPESL